jgi:hypothetical protein
MEKIQCMTSVSRYEYLVVENRHHIEAMIKEKMARDIAYEILKKISITQTTDAASGDHQFRLAFWTTTSSKETKAVDEIMKIIEVAKEIKK